MEPCEMEPCEKAKDLEVGDRIRWTGGTAAGIILRIVSFVNTRHVWCLAVVEFEARLCERYRLGTIIEVLKKHIDGKYWEVEDSFLSWVKNERRNAGVSDVRA